MTVYLETSAAAKLIVHETETRAVSDFLRRLEAGTAVISSQLLETELRRMAVRVEVAQAEVSSVLSRVNLIHEDAAVMVSYDRRMVAAAAKAGLETISPA